jgi:hypothetical protein
MSKQKKTPGVANEAYIVAMREIRRSNAAGTHDARPARERSRADAKRAAIRRDAQ